MGIVLVVAVVTCRRRITVLFPFFMAAGACESQVCAFQRKIGLMMVEGVRVEVDNISIASNMLGMAGFTGPFFDIFYAPVESSLFLDIRRDLLVAFETPFFLRVLAERLVAFFTLGFIFGVVTYHLARHDQGFQAGGGGCQRKDGHHDSGQGRREVSFECDAHFPRSIQMYCDHMHDAGYNQHQE